MVNATGLLDKAIDHLNFIINNQNRSLRMDIVLYARILLIMDHYDQGNNGILDHLINGTKRILLKVTPTEEPGEQILTFLKRLNTTELLNREALRLAFEKEIDALYQQKTNRRSLIFLDFRLWLKAKMSGKKIEEIAQTSLQTSTWNL